MTPADLTPTQELILDLLGARHRLGEPFWPVDRRFTRALDGLEAEGLIRYQPDGTNRRVWLNPAGRQLACDATYESPVEKLLWELTHAFIPGPFLCSHRDLGGRLCPHPAGHPTHRTPQVIRGIW